MRINVEARALAEGRFHNFKDDLGISRAEAIGILVLFWHDSQERRIVSGNKKTLLKFIAVEESRRERVFNALLSHDYITEDKDNSYEIKGNLKHVEFLNRQKALASLGGKSRWKKQNKTTTSKRSLKSPQAMGKKNSPNSIQFNSIQSNAIQDNSNQFNSDQSNSEKINISSAAARNLEPEFELEEPSTRPNSVQSRGAVDSFSTNVTVSGLLEDVTHRVQEAWLSAYPDVGWVIDEILKANAWMAANPLKRPKKFDRFMTNWLAKAHESHRKGIPSRRLTNSELNAQIAADLWNKADKGEL